MKVDIGSALSPEWDSRGEDVKGERSRCVGVAAFEVVNGTAH